MKKILGIILLLIGIFLLLSAFPATRPITDTLRSSVGLGSDHSANRVMIRQDEDFPVGSGNDHSTNREIINQEKDFLDIANGSGGLVSLVISILVLFRKGGK